MTSSLQAAAALKAVVRPFAKQKADRQVAEVMKQLEAMETELRRKIERHRKGDCSYPLQMLRGLVEAAAKAQSELCSYVAVRRPANFASTGDTQSDHAAFAAAAQDMLERLNLIAASTKLLQEWHGRNCPDVLAFQPKLLDFVIAVKELLSAE